MIVPGENGYRFDHATITSFAPPQSGVYAIYNQKGLIYFGEGQDIQAKLLAHLKGDNPRILKHRPTAFTYELVPDNQRLARLDQLIRRFGSECNKKLG